MPLTLHARQDGHHLRHPLARLRHRQHPAGHLRLRLLDLALGLGVPPSSGLEAGVRGRGHGVGLVELALGDIPVLHEPAHPVLLPQGLLGHAAGTGDLRAHGRHGRPLGLDLCPRLVDSGLGGLLGHARRRQRGLGLLGLGARGLEHELGVRPRGLEAGGSDGHRRPRLVAPSDIVARVDP